MKIEDKSMALARWIQSVLTGGLPLPDHVLNYMEGTFGTADLTEIMDADETGEMDSLLELILFPDMDLQIRYEAKWGQQPFTQKDLAAVQSALGHSTLTIDLMASEEGPGIAIEVPLFALNSFVQRLNITWQLPPRLLTTFDQKWPDAKSLNAKVHLRNARLEWHEDQVRLVNHFLTDMAPEAVDTEICLTFLLSILSEFSPGTDPYNFLIAKKFFYFQSLCKAEDFERRRNTSNMEIMMLQGDRAAHGSVAEWRQQMQWIDSITYALFGRTHFFQQPDEQCMALPSGDNKQIMDNVIRSLS